MIVSQEKPTVLVVDDSEAIRTYVSTLLADAGYRVRQAADGSACLSALEESSPDVVLLDIEMPGLSGLDVLRTQRLQSRIFSVILFTSQSSLEQITAGLDLGADDYVVKPFRETELLARIRACVRSSRQKVALAQAQQETERALIQLKKAQRKLVEQETVGAVARLAAGAAHYINNPLGFVMSNLSTLDRYAMSLMRHAASLAAALREADPEADRRIAELEKENRIRQVRQDLPALLEETREGGLRIALIVQQMAQLELGLANREEQELELASVVRPLVQMVSVLAPPGSTVQWADPGQEVHVVGSLTLLNTALMALLKNACEALGSAPGTVTVAVASRQELAEITISDTGSGIPHEHIHSLFDPFFTTKAADSHVGLGLTIAQRFIAGHGGRILVSSDASGTSVRIEIPLAPSPAATSRISHN